MNRLAALGIVGLISLGVVTACGSDDDDSASDIQDANAAFCQDLTAYSSAIKGLTDLDPATATKAEYTSAVDAVTSSHAAVVSSGQYLGEAEWANLQAQIATLTGDLPNAPDDAAVSSILAAADAQATTVRASVATLNTAICTVGGATTTTG